MTKKILFISHWYPSDKNPNSGIFIQKHAKAISVHSDIKVVHFDIQYSSKILDIKLIKIDNSILETYKIQIYSKFYKVFYYQTNLQFLLFEKLIKKFRIDVSTFDLIHSNVLFPSGIVANKISNKYKIKQVHTEHWSKISKFLANDILRNKGKQTLKNIVALSSVSSSFKEELKQFYTEKNIFVIPNVVDNSVFFYQNLSKSKDKIKFLSVANWQVPKYPFYFLDALEEIYKNSLFEFEMTIAGEGIQLEQIKSKNYSFKINFLGNIKSKKINELLNESHFLLHASKFETFSVIIVESLLAGTPVLVSEVGVAPELINENNGYLCKNTKEDWLKKINIAVQNKYNYAEISDEIKEKYNYSNVALMFEDMYDFALS
jgi:glycosyltransferase involved in cell wall biosynthesis